MSVFLFEFSKRQNGLNNQTQYFVTAHMTLGKVWGRNWRIETQQCDRQMLELLSFSIMKTKKWIWKAGFKR